MHGRAALGYLQVAWWGRIRPSKTRITHNLLQGEATRLEETFILAIVGEQESILPVRYISRRFPILFPPRENRRNRKSPNVTTLPESRTT